MLEAYLTRPRTLQFWASALVVLPVFIQAPWVHFYPFSACLFTFALLGIGLWLFRFAGDRWINVGSIIMGVSGSWLGGSLFWGWLRAYPFWHLPVEAIALPVALIGLNTKWRIGAGFYLSCLLGTAFTDLMMLCTGVMKAWPEVLQASLIDAPRLLNNTAQNLLHPIPMLLLFGAAFLILLISGEMRQRSNPYTPAGNTWLVASASLTTTLWVDGLFLITAFFEPKLSGLI